MPLFQRPVDILESERQPARRGFFNRLDDGRWRNVLIGILPGLVALGLAFVAHSHGRPVTAALVAVFGVISVGALLGLRAGVIAGAVASITYNLLFTDPVLQFSLTSADDLVPILALNVSAIAAGLVAGTLHDRAVAAERSGRRVAELLRFSQDLQGAVTLEQVEEAATCHFGGDRGAAQLFVDTEGRLRTASPTTWGLPAAKELWVSLLADLRLGNQISFELKSADRRLGVLVIESKDTPDRAEEIKVFLPLLTLAIQRCRLAEQLSEADIVRRSEKFKTALLSSVSHDLRTPLAAISASATSLASFGDKLDEDTKTDLLETIQEQCERLDRFTANLLNLGRIESGLDVDRMPVVDAVEVLGSSLSRIRRMNRSEKIERNFGVSSALVRADESLLEQVFLNVLENAVVHTPPHTLIKVDASTTTDELIIAVEDDGSGIPADEQDRIFERFYQVQTARRSGTGSGLGLSIAKGFTDVIGGTIAAGVAQSPMKGTRIEVRLPLMQSAQ